MNPDTIHLVILLLYITAVNPKVLKEQRTEEHEAIRILIRQLKKQVFTNGNDFRRECSLLLCRTMCKMDLYLSFVCFTSVYLQLNALINAI